MSCSAEEPQQRIMWPQMLRAPTLCNAVTLSSTSTNVILPCSPCSLNTPLGSSKPWYLSCSKPLHQLAPHSLGFSSNVTSSEMLSLITLCQSTLPPKFITGHFRRSNASLPKISYLFTSSFLLRLH